MTGGLLRKRDAARLERESANRMRDNKTDEATDARVPLQRQRALVHAHSSDTKKQSSRASLEANLIWAAFHLLWSLFGWERTEYQ